MIIKSEEQQSMRFSAKSHWAAYAAAIWSVLYIPPHVYFALGGTIGVPGTMTEKFEPVWALTNWGASFALLLAGLLALGLARPMEQKMVRLALLVVSWCACLIPILHASYGFVTKGLYLLGVLPIHFFDFSLWETVDIGMFMMLDLLLFEPWFLVEGILFGLAIWQFHRRAQVKIDANHAL
ncbi:DUF3995 domain-containing protein [Paenibacillus sp. KQZ6P-2]|uniref:DUF3995 domain-containing protein n=1 Tax=Paenibacillus mangrovi TaxID=2931978 RepID=A0A9X1WRL5_9BACL|nr:DUF3995 domain-containing protein [Paenibacillus mangrovi]MCJ8010414.1 DUF3995 domain-containing protein [Paenibacillus mangrovi]